MRQDRSVFKSRSVGFLATVMLFAINFPGTSRAVQIYEQFPVKINAKERYVIFSHGFIAEGEDPRPVSPQFGVYDFPQITQAIFAGGGFNLVAVQRKKNVELEQHVGQLATWVRQLVDAGVKPSRISIVGFSRGGQITAFASSRLASVGINTALLAICTDGDFDAAPEAPVVLGGHLLSVYETSDMYGSCAKLAQRSHLASFKEVAISTGKAHGAFFQPRPDWIRPLKDWIAKTNR